MNKKHSYVLILLILVLLSSLLPCGIAENDYKLRYCQNDAGKKGVQNEHGEWIIPPIYEMITNNDGIYWVFLKPNDGEMVMGLIDVIRGVAIPAQYDDILINKNADELIVAYNGITRVYDIFDTDWRLIYTLPGEYDYVIPNGTNCIDWVDLDGIFHTIHLPSYRVTVN